MSSRPSHLTFVCRFLPSSHHSSQSVSFACFTTHDYLLASPASLILILATAVTLQPSNPAILYRRPVMYIQPHSLPSHRPNEGTPSIRARYPLSFFFVTCIKCTPLHAVNFIPLLRLHFWMCYYECGKVGGDVYHFDWRWRS